MRFYFQFILSTFLFGIHANSLFCTQANCTCHERDLEIALKKNIPWPNIPSWTTGDYFSNAHNISRALYPYKKAPQKFIFIKVKFYNTSGYRHPNVEHYIWTLSCIYAVLPRDILAAVSWGTLYHEREVLVLSLPEFCNDVPRKKYMVNALSSLQDLAIIPSLSDPRLNTAECVDQLDNDSGDAANVNQLMYVRREYGDTNQLYNSEEQHQQSITLSVFHLLVCIFVGILVGRILYTKEIKNKHPHRKNALKITAVVMMFSEFCLLSYTCTKYAIMATRLCNAPSSVILIIFPFFYVIVMIIVLLSVLVPCCRRKVKSKLNFCHLFYLLSVAVCYHFLWILLGLFANPSWTFSLLLPIFSLILLVYILAYSYSYSRNLYGKCQLICSSFLLLSMFFIFVAFTWISMRFFLVNELVSSSIQTLLFAILGTLFSFISYFKPESLLEICTSTSNRQHDVKESNVIEIM